MEVSTAQSARALRTSKTFWHLQSIAKLLQKYEFSGGLKWISWSIDCSNWMIWQFVLQSQIVDSQVPKFKQNNDLITETVVHTHTHFKFTFNWLEFNSCVDFLIFAKWLTNAMIHYRKSWNAHCHQQLIAPLHHFCSVRLKYTESISISRNEIQESIMWSKRKWNWSRFILLMFIYTYSYDMKWPVA